MPWSMPRGGPSPSSSRPARPMTAEARSICWTVWARETSCSLTAPTTPTLCVRRSRNAAPGRASNQCPDASTLRLSVPFFIVTETSSSASSTNSSTSAPSPRDTKNTPTTTSHSSSSLPSEYGCDLMSLCLRDVACEATREWPWKSGTIARPSLRGRRLRDADRLLLRAGQLLCLGHRQPDRKQEAAASAQELAQQQRQNDRRLEVRGKGQVVAEGEGGADGEGDRQHLVARTHPPDQA